jgi:hypothetical protein
MPPLAGASGADFDCDLDFLPILKNFLPQKKSISLGFIQQGASDSGWGRLRISPNFFFLWAYRSWRGSCRASHDFVLGTPYSKDINNNINTSTQFHIGEYGLNGMAKFKKVLLMNI